MTQHRPPIDDVRWTIIGEALGDLRLLDEHLVRFRNGTLPKDRLMRHMIRLEAWSALVALFTASGMQRHLASRHAEDFLRHFIGWWS